MKFFALVLVSTLLSATAYSEVQTWPIPGRYTPVPGNYYPQPHPGNYYPQPGYGYPNHDRAARFSCYYSDLYRNNRTLIHRFGGRQSCSLAVQQITKSGRFCDGNEMYDFYGNFIKAYRNKFFCHGRLLLE